MSADQPTANTASVLGTAPASSLTRAEDSVEPDATGSDAESEYTLWPRRERSRAEVEGDAMTRDWGGSDSDVLRGMEHAQRAVDRLGLSKAEVAKLVDSGPARKREELTSLRELGMGFESLPDDITPAEARERLAFLNTDKDHMDAMKRGDKRARYERRALIHLASRGKDL